MKLRWNRLRMVIDLLTKRVGKGISRSRPLVRTRGRLAIQNDLLPRDLEVRLRQQRRRCGGQALVEFALLLTVMVVACVEIYQMITWSGDSVKAQSASWFVARSQTFDFRHNNTSQDEINPLLQQAVFTDQQPFETKSDVTGNDNYYEPFLMSFDVLGIPSLDISLLRKGKVTAWTRDHFEHMPSIFNLAGRESVAKDGHRSFKSEGSSIVFASWTSAAENHNFDKETAGKNSDEKHKIDEEKAKLEKEAKKYDQKAADHYEKWLKEKDPKRKAEDYQKYESAKAEAAKIRKQENQL